jgi:hypothetical protein
MADPSDSERLALVEELLVLLLTGLRPEHVRDLREANLQEILGTALRRLSIDRQIQFEKAFSASPGLARVSSHVLELEQRLTALERRLDATRETQRELLLAVSQSPALALHACSNQPN